jgi:hypothetical protein
MKKTTAWCIKERITIIPYVLYASIARLNYPSRKDSLITISITPFIQFTVRFSFKNPDPNIPPKLPKGKEFRMCHGTATQVMTPSGKPCPVVWHLPVTSEPGQDTPDHLVWCPEKMDWQVPEDWSPRDED